MNKLAKFENWINLMIDDCDEIHVENILRTIRWQFKLAAAHDIRKNILFNICANDETILYEG